MAATYDNDNEASATAASSVTIGAFAVANNANRAMVVGIAGWDATAADLIVSSVSHNGSTTGWAQKGTQSQGGDGNDRTAIWGKTAPDAVTATVVVTMAGVCAELGANATSVHGVDQTTSFGTTAGAEGVTATATVTVSGAANDLVYALSYFNYSGSAGATWTDETARADFQVVAGGEFTAATEAAVGASTVMDFVAVGTMLNWNIIGVAVKAAAAAGANPLPLVDRYLRGRRA